MQFDLVICTYNNAGLLDRTLAALALQKVPEWVDWRVLVVNNNCTDETDTVVESHAGAIPDLRLVHEPLQGLTPARLRGVRETDGDWVALVDDDCLLQPGWVEAAARFVLLHPDCGAMGGRVVPMWPFEPPGYVRRNGFCFAEQDHGHEPIKVDSLVGAGMLIRRQALVDSGWIDRQFLDDRVGKTTVSGGDVEIALRIRGAGYQLWYNPECVIHHVIPAHRLTRRYLFRINRGLGVSHIESHLLTVSRPYEGWFLPLFMRTLRAARTSAWWLIKLIRLRGQSMDAVLYAGFVSGMFTGLMRLVFMPGARRRALVGCAARTPVAQD